MFIVMDRNVRKAYFDRRTTPSEFCFETNILCNPKISVVEDNE